MNKLFLICSMWIFLSMCRSGHSDKIPEIYQYNPNLSTRWISFENKSGAISHGGFENHGAKGHPCDHINKHSSITLMDFDGVGLIDRIWMTIDDRSAYMCRGLLINMYWDKNDKPAVSAPVGDFFGLGSERKIAFENELFSSGEGRSFISHIKMPFKSHAKIELVNDTDKDLDMIFYDIDLQVLRQWDPGNLYFHAFWHRDTATQLEHDFEILPHVTGKGKYLGANLSVFDNPVYQSAWWGEGEVKMYIDADQENPTIVGTGTEDYIGTAWGQGVFQNKFSGCLIGDAAKRYWAFYRYHIPDPVFFHSGCQITIQQIGGNSKDKVKSLMDAQVSLIPITVHKAPTFIHIYKKDSLQSLQASSLPDGWVNFYRSDDVASMTYFYLDQSTNGLPAIQPLIIRTYKMQ